MQPNFSRKIQPPPFLDRVGDSRERNGSVAINGLSIKGRRADCHHGAVKLPHVEPERAAHRRVVNPDYVKTDSIRIRAELTGTFDSSYLPLGAYVSLSGLNGQPLEGGSV